MITDDNHRHSTDAMKVAQGFTEVGATLFSAAGYTIITSVSTTPSKEVEPSHPTNEATVASSVIPSLNLGDVSLILDEVNTIMDLTYQGPWMIKCHQSHIWYEWQEKTAIDSDNDDPLSHSDHLRRSVTHLLSLSVNLSVLTAKTDHPTHFHRDPIHRQGLLDVESKQGMGRTRTRKQS